MFGDKKENMCKPCGGTGVQILKSGLRVECPSCSGTGKRNSKPSKVEWT